MGQMENHGKGRVQLCNGLSPACHQRGAAKAAFIDYSDEHQDAIQEERGKDKLQVQSQRRTKDFTPSNGKL